jgi:hypothetical protein
VILRYRSEIIYAIKTLVPIAGILFFDWSIGTIFLFFLLEILFIGAQTVLRIFFAALSTLGQKIGGIFRFALIFSILALFIFILMGNFFKGNGPGNMKANFEIEIIYVLIAINFIDFIFGFIVSKKFKTSTCKSVEKETYYLLLIYG